MHRNGLRSSDGDFRAYALRRFFRVYPVYLAATVFGLLVTSVYWSRFPAISRTMFGSGSVDYACIVAKLTGVAALTSAFHPCSYVGNPPLLTVTVELMLYVVYGLVFATVIDRLGESAVWIAGIALFATNVAVASRAGTWPTFYDWYQHSSLWGYLPFWWVGVACVSPRAAGLLKARSGWVAALWLVLTLWLLTKGPDPVVSEIRELVFCALSGLAIVLIDENFKRGSFVSYASGAIAYNLYAFSSPIAIYAVSMGLPWWSAVLLCVVAAAISHVCIEKPGMALGRSLVKRCAPRDDRSRDLPDLRVRPRPS